ncbi:MAG: DedA family protein [Cyanobacteria bacterium K_Offshore_surface_m2_239]|nr:DedA family protein [Cyanobacteria bacterium K_Offshore_surface_m2_239]
MPEEGISLLKTAVEALPRLIQAGADRHPLLGYVLITLGMFLENLVPPIPAELIMPLGGFLAHKGQLQLLPVILSGLLGTVLGAWFWYGIGRLINEERLEHLVGRHGRWLGVTPAGLRESRRWFQRHGAAVVFWGRLVPGVRTLISVPAGIELMPQPGFLAWTTAGSSILVTALALAGKTLGENYGRVLRWMEPFSELVIRSGLALAGFGLLFLLLRRSRLWLRR